MKHQYSVIWYMTLGDRESEALLSPLGSSANTLRLTGVSCVRISRVLSASTGVLINQTLWSGECWWANNTDRRASSCGNQHRDEKCVCWWVGGRVCMYVTVRRGQCKCVCSQGQCLTNITVLWQRSTGSITRSVRVTRLTPWWSGSTCSISNSSKVPISLKMKMNSRNVNTWKIKILHIRISI